MSGAAQAQSATQIFGSDRMWGLKEAPLPEPVSWMPQTAGWLVVAVLLVAFLAFYARRRWLLYQANRYRRDGLAALLVMENDLSAAEDLPHLLRASALQCGSRQEVAGLRGVEWINWLNTTAKRPVFETDAAETLDTLAYGSRGSSDIEPDELRQLIVASEVWMRTHNAAV